MFNFENLHKNKKLAFVDGVLCGVTLTLIGAAYIKEYRENRKWKRLADALDACSETEE